MDEREIVTREAQTILRLAGFSDVHVSWAEETPDRIDRLLIESPSDISLLIGKQGATLEALEHLIRMAVARKAPSNFIVDINDYRKSQTEALLTMAHTIAKEVLQTHRAQSLSPMPAYERKLIHAALMTYSGIQTRSIGLEPHRRIVIAPADSLASLT